MILLLQSIFVYSLFAFLLYKNANKVTYNQVKVACASGKCATLPNGYKSCIWIFVLFSGIRYNVGVDYSSYLDSYLSAMDGSFVMRERGIEWGYQIITQAFGFLHIHPTIYFAFFAFLQIYFIIQSMKDERDVMPYMMLVMILGTCYLSWMNGIRQMIVACSFVWATKFILDRNLKKFLLWMAFAYLWHKSCIILIFPFLLTYSNSLWNKRWINILIFIVCFILGNEPFWISFLTRIEGLLTFLGYNNYAEHLNELVEVENLNKLAFGPRMLVVFISYLLVIFYYPKLRTKFENQKKIDLFYKLFYVGACGYYLFVNTTVVFQRPIQYFDIFALPMIAYTLVYLKKSGNPVFYLALLTSMSFLFLQCFNDYSVPEIARRATLFQFYPFFQ